MALTKEEVIDKIEIVGDCRHIQVRTASVIKEDGVEISRSFKRHILDPDTDITNETLEIRDICNVVHSQGVKDKWANKKKKGA